LKDEHEICLENGYCWDANAIQNLILEFLQMVRDGNTEVLVSAKELWLHSRPHTCVQLDVIAWQFQQG
jgi:hypothetical protein